MCASASVTLPVVSQNGHTAELRTRLRGFLPKCDAHACSGLLGVLSVDKVLPMRVAFVNDAQGDIQALPLAPQRKLVLALALRNLQREGGDEGCVCVWREEALVNT